MTHPTFDARALREGRPLRWAVLAPGEIAADFTRTLHSNSSHRVVAVGSRSLDRAEAFAARCGGNRLPAQRNSSPSNVPAFRHFSMYRKNACGPLG